jgi:hypothetical protein
MEEKNHDESFTHSSLVMVECGGLARLGGVARHRGNLAVKTTILEPGRRPAAEALAWAKACALASHGLSASRGGAVGSAVSRVAPERGGAVLLDAGRSRRRAGDGAGKGERRRFCWRPGGAGRQRRLQSLIEILLSACCRTKICTCPAIAGTILPTGQIGRTGSF